MADVQYTQGMGAAGFAHHDDTSQFQTVPEGGNTLKTFTHLTGAALSLALIVGVGVWGYKLIARDVSGIPVVRAAEGEMRIRPEDPGGQLARNTGLAVNEVAALGTAGAPADTLHLAPEPVELDPADMETAPALPAPVAAPQQPVEVALEGQSVADIVAALTEGVAPMEPVEPVPEPAAPVVAPTPVEPEPVAPEPAVQPAVLSGAGLNVSLRPVPRPVAARPAAPVVATPAPAQTGEIDPSTLAAGTRLAQLGAYDSAEVARSEWARFDARFGSYMAGKDRVVQRAQSGGRTFYRLRVHGFADLAEARRFCAALAAEGQDCIPVVTR
ncbi:MAG: SPOR domain-containing protein [Pseudomonadota bacterium]